MFWFFFSNPFTHVNIVNLKIKTKSHYFAHQIRITKPILLQNLNLKPILLQNLSSSHTLTSPPLNPKLTLSFPQNQNPKLRFSHYCRRHHEAPPLHLLVFLYYTTHSLPVIIFNWKSNSIPNAQVRLLSSFSFLWI